MDLNLYQATRQSPAGDGCTAQLYQLAVSPGAPGVLVARMRWALLLVAALLLASGLIFWVAANWQDQSRMFKLGLIEGALVLSVLAACLWPRGRVAALLCATLVLGGLLAFVGQTYQTGADAWQLFAAWAALALVWVALARSDVLWTLWVLIAATGIVMWSGRLDLWDVLLGARQSLRLAVVNMGWWLLLVLVPIAVAQLPLLRTPQGLGWAYRLALGCALAAWTAMGVSNIVESVFRHSAPLVLLVCALMGASLAASLWGPLQDFVGVCLAALAANVMVLAVVVRWAVEATNDPFAVLFVCAIAGLLCLGGTVLGLVAVQRRMRHVPAAPVMATEVQP